MKLIYCVLLCLLLGNLQAQVNLPDIVDSSGSVISPEFERRLGKALVRSLRKHTDIITDPEIENYIESIGYRLVANSDTNTLPFTFFVVDDPNINAFAAPGGVIGINSGTILKSQNESELAAVMAHEIAHVTQRHIARSIEKQSQSNLPSVAALFGAILLSVIDPQIGSAALTVLTGAKIQNQINFTRENEQEADSVGIVLLARSGYDPQGMPSFFERLQQASTSHFNSAPEFLRTHPLTLSRIADSKDRVTRYPEVDYLNTNSYELIRIKLEVLNYKHSADAVSAFKHRLVEESPIRERFNRYGYAIALIQAQEYQLAREQLELLLKWDEDNVTYMLAKANVESLAKNVDATFALFRQTYRLYPDYKPLVMSYARALLDNEQPEMARDLLRYYGRQRELGPLYYDLLAQADAQSGVAVAAGLSKAEYFYLTGDTKAAIERLQQIVQDSQPSAQQQEIIAARVSELEYELELEEELQI